MQMFAADKGDNDYQPRQPTFLDEFCPKKSSSKMNLKFMLLCIVVTRPAQLHFYCTQSANNIIFLGYVQLYLRRGIRNCDSNNNGDNDDMFVLLFYWKIYYLILIAGSTLVAMMTTVSAEEIGRVYLQIVHKRCSSLITKIQVPTLFSLSLVLWKS